MKQISTRCDLKHFAEQHGWALLTEDKGAIVFLLKTGQTLAAKYDSDTDKITQINDAVNSVVIIPFSFKEEDEEEV